MHIEDLAPFRPRSTSEFGRARDFGLGAGDRSGCLCGQEPQHAPLADGIAILWPTPSGGPMSKPPRRCLLRHDLVLPLLLLACSTDFRQGPPFDEVLPDASVLVTTTDPASVRAQLDGSQLPDSKAHQDRLLALLRSRQQLQAAHVVLLANAVG